MLKFSFLYVDLGLEFEFECSNLDYQKASANGNIKF